MGTNYYANINTCICCKKPEEVIHLGKASMGWKFCFQYNGGRYYKNVKEMKQWLKAKNIVIVDEYGGKTSYKKFWEFIERKQKDKLDMEHGAQDSHVLVIDGYDFLDCEFS